MKQTRWHFIVSIGVASLFALPIAKAQSNNNPECINVPNNPDPCCVSPIPSWCPINGTNAWDVTEGSAEQAIENYLISIGVPDNFIGAPLAGSIADGAAGYIVDRGQDLLDRLNGVGNQTTPTTLMDYLPLLGGSEQLTTLLVASVASIGPAAQNSLANNTAYNIPYIASTDLIEACREISYIHKDRNFNHSLMRPIVSTGQNLIYKTNVGVPTEIHAVRPSWSTRQIRDHYWMWWFGDSSMVPRSSEDMSGTNHVYSRLGDHDLAFVMLETDIEWSLNFSSNVNDSVSWSDFNFSFGDTDNESPDACNYATMRVLANNAPNAAISVANYSQPNKKRFSASNSSDPDGNPLTYNWQFSNGTTATGSTVIRTFTVPRPRTMTATLTVSDGGRSDTTVQSFQVSPDTGACGPGTGQSCQ